MTKFATPTTPCLSFLLVMSLAACGGGGDPGTGGGTSDHSHEGPHGGQVLEVGAEVAHLEVVHDEDAGSMRLYVLGPDAATPMACDEAPVLRLSSAEPPVQLTAAAVDGEVGAFTVASHDALKVHGPEGRITLVIGGKTYNPTLTHEH